MNIKEIKNFIQASELIASSGQPTEQQIKFIAFAGYEVIINLAMPNSDNAIPEEGNIVTALKMIYIHIPVPYEAPNKTHLNNFLHIMEALSNQKVWVHCALNYRVSAFLYQYGRLSLKVNHQEAQKFMLPSWNPDDVWQEFMLIGESRNAL
ncbi:hypothetical protein SPONN_1707 [uncultured Candidatus Thioglobus sp.]|nr:hypothetical protein SPONN_1707 [uncultured Candidatus Thioglobus sp.]